MLQIAVVVGHAVAAAHAPAGVAVVIGVRVSNPRPILRLVNL